MSLEFQRCSLAPPMLMPEAIVDENDPLFEDGGQVWCSGKVAPVQAEAIAKPVNDLPYT